MISEPQQGQNEAQKQDRVRSPVLHKKIKLIKNDHALNDIQNSNLKGDSVYIYIQFSRFPHHSVLSRRMSLYPTL